MLFAFAAVVGCSVLAEKRSKSLSAGQATSLLAFEQDKMFGFKDATGRIVIPARYYEMGSFSEGLVRAITNVSDPRVGLRWTYFTKEGDQAFPGMFDEARDFCEKRAWVMVTNNVMLIDTNGSVLAQGRWAAARSFSEGLAAVNVGGDWFGCGGLWGYVDRQGNYAIEPRYTAAQPFKDGLAIVATNGSWTIQPELALVGAKFGVINKSGHYVIMPRWKHIRQITGTRFALISYDEPDWLFEASPEQREWITSLQATNDPSGFPIGFPFD
jgi:hypothetical protein